MYSNVRDMLDIYVWVQKTKIKNTCDFKDFQFIRMDHQPETMKMKSGDFADEWMVLYMRVSWNNWNLVLMGLSVINQPVWDPPFMDTPI